MASISETQKQAISDLEAGLDKLNPRNLKFATDLVNKGQKWSLSEPQMFYVRKFIAEASGEATESASKPKSTPSSEPVGELVDKLDSLRPYLSAKSQNFAQSLIRQGRNKGWLSDKQMPFVHKMIAEAEESKAGRATRDAKRAARAAAREAHRIATTPVSDDDAEEGYEAVLELFDAAGSTLTRTKIHLITDSGREVVVRSNRRKAESNSVLYVHHHGAEKSNRDAQFGHITKDTAAWNYTPATSEEVRAVMATFRDNPVQTVIDMGRKSGRCCFCSLPLTDERSTAHGYGKICAGHYGLAWSRATARVIEGVIEAKVLEVLIMQDDKGNFAVKDRESGETIATFDSREKANAFSDQFSLVESI